MDSARKGRWYDVTAYGERVEEENFDLLAHLPSDERQRGLGKQRSGSMPDGCGDAWSGRGLSLPLREAGIVEWGQMIQNRKLYAWEELSAKTPEIIKIKIPSTAKLGLIPAMGVYEHKQIGVAAG
ncbi:hypothetical protein NDU88_002016 [Pleurodeles waltl]|uniref:Uncharacterized protein n=1 Tax=Pleurodeles waltl TaxID=8319 RepID=A0AAV7NE89_PLEWA|nr:hypothetical protein NDU88_002016 [Pleurodeles waltl]